MSPTATNDRVADARGLARRLAGLRAVVVLFGGPLLMTAATIAGAVDAARSLRSRRPTRPASICVLGAALAYAGAIRPWTACWGTTRAERSAAMAGDETVPNPSLQLTHAVAIAAPAADVWPWLVQIGQDRGGFYSHTWLENLAGCRMRNADRVHPEWQRREVGQVVPLHPDLGLRLLRCEHKRAFVMENGWYFGLEPDGPDRCRLLARFRAPAGPVGLAFGLLFELPHFIMERGMLLGIKRRAEGRRRRGPV